MQQQQTRRPPAAGHTDARGDEKINAAQRKRMFAILRSSGRDEATFRIWLKGHYGLDSTKDVQRRDYDAICSMIESTAPMFASPARAVDDDSNMHEGPHERQPGEDD